MRNGARSPSFDALDARSAIATRHGPFCADPALHVEAWGVETSRHPARELALAVGGVGKGRGIARRSNEVDDALVRHGP